MHSDSKSQVNRQNWMAVLSKAKWSDLDRLWAAFSNKAEFKILRKPETGLVMLRARMGGSGQPFNTGEATVTRCSVQDQEGRTGHAYILGRNKEHALAAAQIDAGLQDADSHLKLFEAVVVPLEDIAREKLESHRRKTAATKVDFFTMVRGEDD